MRIRVSSFSLHSSHVTNILSTSLWGISHHGGSLVLTDAYTLVFMCVEQIYDDWHGTGCCIDRLFIS